ERQTRAVAEFLTALDDEGADADRKPPKVISPVDPCSAWTAKANRRVQFGYGLNYLIDIEYAVIVDVEATPARTYDEVAATKTMIKRADERLGLKPERVWRCRSHMRLQPVRANCWAGKCTRARACFTSMASCQPLCCKNASNY